MESAPRAAVCASRPRRPLTGGQWDFLTRVSRSRSLQRVRRERRAAAGSAKSSRASRRVAAPSVVGRRGNDPLVALGRGSDVRHRRPLGLVVLFVDSFLSRLGSF